jgi:hypothetical protein
VTPRKDNKPALAGSWSSRNKSSGTLKAPWAQTRANPTIEAEIKSDPTLVKKITTIVETTRIPSVSRSENERPRITKGWSDGRNR